MNKIEQAFKNHEINPTPELLSLVEQVVQESVQWVDQNPISYPFKTFGEGLHQYWHQDRV